MSTKTPRLLRADEIEVRMGNSNKNKTGFSLLLYKDARCDMNILDEMFGAEMWQRDHKMVGDAIYCGVGVNYGTMDAPYWIWKWDAGSPSQTDPDKGAASDSFKRACVNASGCGRELYTAPFIWISENPDNCKFEKWRVSEIGYNDNREITLLVIVNAKTRQEVFTFGNGTTKSNTKTKPQVSAPSAPQGDDINFIVSCTTDFLKSRENGAEWALSVANNEYGSLEELPQSVLLACYNSIKNNADFKSYYADYRARHMFK